jgi:hypothetical protein
MQARHSPPSDDPSLIQVKPTPRLSGKIRSAKHLTSTLDIKFGGPNGQHIMNTDDKEPPRWSTSSFGGETATSPMELAALKEQLEECNGARGKLFALRCFGESAHDFVVSRFVTTLMSIALAALVVALVLWAWRALG